MQMTKTQVDGNFDFEIGDEVWWLEDNWLAGEQFIVLKCKCCDGKNTIVGRDGELWPCQNWRCDDGIVSVSQPLYKAVDGSVLGFDIKMRENETTRTVCVESNNHPYGRSREPGDLFLDRGAAFLAARAETDAARGRLQKELDERRER